MAHDVFISYSSEDKKAADAICARFESDGIRCWIAPRDVPAGAKWPPTILAAIRQSRALVLVFSGASNQSDQVENEVRSALDAKLPVLPFKIEDAEYSDAMQFMLANRHWLDALTPPLEAHIAELARQVRALFGSPQPPAVPTRLGAKRSPRWVAVSGMFVAASLGVGAWMTWQRGSEQLTPQRRTLDRGNAKPPETATGTGASTIAHANAAKGPEMRYDYSSSEWYEKEGGVPPVATSAALYDDGRLVAEARLLSVLDQEELKGQTEKCPDKELVVSEEHRSDDGKATYRGEIDLCYSGPGYAEKLRDRASWGIKTRDPFSRWPVGQRAVGDADASTPNQLAKKDRPSGTSARASPMQRGDAMPSGPAARKEEDETFQVEALDVSGWSGRPIKANVSPAGIGYVTEQGTVTANWASISPSWSMCAIPNKDQPDPERMPYWALSLDFKKNEYPKDLPTRKMNDGTGHLSLNVIDTQGGDRMRKVVREHLGDPQTWSSCEESVPR